MTEDNEGVTGKDWLEVPAAILNLKNVPEVDRTLWVRESRANVVLQLESGWVHVHRMIGQQWVPYTVATVNIVTVAEYH
jgi:hypothetical protein